MARLKLGVLISGGGTNLQALLDAAADPDCAYEIGIVLSNNPDAGGLQRARDAGVPAHAVNHRDYETREEFEVAMTDVLEDAGVGLICLAGFMRLLTREFVDRWHNRLINIHPSLLPAFKGLHVHERVLETGARITGCTVHYVRHAMDAGPIIIQGAVPVLPGDTPDELAARVLTVEHQIYPMAVKLIATGSARVTGDTVILDTDNAGTDQLISPSAGD